MGTDMDADTRHVLTYVTPLVTALVIILLSVVAYLSPSLTDLLSYQPAAVLDGQLWRMLTAHWVHLSLSHALLNLAGLGLIALFFAHRMDTYDWLLGIVGCGLLISLSLWIWMPTVQWYMGFSGCLYGLMSIGIIRLLHDQPWIAVALGGLIAGKLGVEQLHGAKPELELLIEGPVLTIAHILGALSGLLLAGARLLVKRPMTGERHRS